MKFRVKEYSMKEDSGELLSYTYDRKTYSIVACFTLFPLLNMGFNYILNGNLLTGGITLAILLSILSCIILPIHYVEINLGRRIITKLRIMRVFGTQTILKEIAFDNVGTIQSSADTRGEYKGNKWVKISLKNGKMVNIFKVHKLGSSGAISGGWMAGRITDYIRKIMSGSRQEPGTLRDEDEAGESKESEYLKGKVIFLIVFLMATFFWVPALVLSFITSGPATVEMRIGATILLVVATVALFIALEMRRKELEERRKTKESGYS